MLSSVSDLSLALTLELSLLLGLELGVDLGAAARLVAVHARRRGRVLLERGDLGRVGIVGLLLRPALLEARREGGRVVWTLAESFLQPQRRLGAEEFEELGGLEGDGQ